MPREFKRTDRVADFLKREMSTLIQQEMRDPRVGMVNVTDVEISRDLTNAKVFVTFIGRESDEEIEEALGVLNSAAGFLRSQVATGSRMRTVPRLRFYYDSSVLRGAHLSALIEQAVEEDRLHEADDEATGNDGAVE